MPTNTMVENIVAIELAYVNTRHPDFYKDMANISSMLKSPDLETERMNQVRVIFFKFKTFLYQILSLHLHVTQVTYSPALDGPTNAPPQGVHPNSQIAQNGEGVLTECCGLE